MQKLSKNNPYYGLDDTFWQRTKQHLIRVIFG